MNCLPQRDKTWTLNSVPEGAKKSSSVLWVYILVFRTKICPAVEPPPEEYEFEKDEL